MRFEWDPEKARTNKIKHGVSFETAQLVWEDPYRFDSHNGYVGLEERREITGPACGMTVLFVIYVEPEPNDPSLIRLISARRATRAERRDYDEAIDG